MYEHTLDGMVTFDPSEPTGQQPPGTTTSNPNRRGRFTLGVVEGTEGNRHPQVATQWHEGTNGHIGRF